MAVPDCPPGLGGHGGDLHDCDRGGGVPTLPAVVRAREARCVHDGNAGGRLDRGRHRRASRAARDASRRRTPDREREPVVVHLPAAGVVRRHR